MTWQERADKVIAQSCMTYSKRYDQFVEGVYDTHCDSKPVGIDMMCACGANLIGWHNSFSLPTQKEVILCERLNKLFPYMEKMKLVKSGSDACEAAVRIARAYHGREEHLDGIGCSYNGWHNWYIAALKPGAGCVTEGFCKLDNLSQVIAYLKKYYNQYCYVIIEPVMLDINVKSQLQEIRSLCTEYNICLIFDEVITGFRVPKYSIANYFGIEPDITCMGKALGNGHALAVVGGKARFMDTLGYFISGTHAGEVAGIEAGLATLDYLSEEKLDYLWRHGNNFMDCVNAMWPEKVQLKGYGTRGEWQGDPEIVAMVWQEMYKQGYFLGRAFFLNFEAVDKLPKMLEDLSYIINYIKKGQVKLEGKLPRAVFRRNG